MNREVEVKNIQMTATVPEDIQISLGTIYNNADTPVASASEDYALNKSTGWLKLDSNTKEAEAPRGVTVTDGSISVAANDELDWSNTADIAAYYSFGKLIPASSTNGANIYYTPDADGVGKTVKSSANYYQAVAGATAYKAGTNSADSITNDTSAKATSHIFSATEKTGIGDTGAIAGDGWAARSDSNAGGYLTATAYNATNDDGYYIDIPVWLRTSSTEAQAIYVTGYVTKGTGTTDNDADDVLYQAVRVAILDGASSGTAQSNAVNGCVILKDGASDATYPTVKLTATGTTGATSILDSDNYNNRTDSSSGVNALNGTTSTSYAAITQNDGDDVVCTLAAGTGQEYGTMSKLYIRVWLEGDDINCWNANAGQDWAISLRFSKIETSTPATPPVGGGD